MVESPINWVGGKHLSAEKIVKMFPEHDCYCETFAGGLSIFFEKPPSKVEVINDVNESLMNFYRVLQRKPKEFLERGKYELYSRSLYYEYLIDFKIKKMHNDGDIPSKICSELGVTYEYMNKIINTEFDDVERAFRFFALIKEAFSAKFNAGWGMGVVRNSATSFFNEFKIIDMVTDKLKRVQIDCRDFEDIIDTYDGDRTLFVFDPPYQKSDNDSYYFQMGNKPFTLSDHQRLYNRFKNIKGKGILTIDNTEWIRERYCFEGSGFYWIENSVHYSSGDANSRRHEIELIITNYDTKNIKPHVDSRQGKLEF